MRENKMITEIDRILSRRAVPPAVIPPSVDVVKLDTIHEVLNDYYETGSYEDGLDDGWAIAVLLCNTNHAERNEIFGSSSAEYIIKNFNPIDIRFMINSYRESKIIKVGDVVTTNSVTGETYIGVVTQITSAQNSTSILHTDGSVSIVSANCIKKTGHHVDMEDVFKEIMKGVDVKDE